MSTFTQALFAFGGLLLIPASAVNGLTVHHNNDNGALQGVDKPTGNPANCTYPTKFFRQLVNHPTSGQFPQTGANDNSATSETFLQQYSVIDDFFKPGGPILFYQGPEDPMQCPESFTLFEYAIELGAMVVGIEHRFFGLSVPSGLLYDNQLEWPTSSLTSLTLENVLMDSVELIKWVKSSVPGAKDSKVVSFGGSYGAFLVALLRIHYPDVIFASMASSGVFSGLVSDPYNRMVYSLGQWVCLVNFVLHIHFANQVCTQNSQVIQDGSANASAKIKTAIADVRERMVAEKFGGLKEGLRSVLPSV